jgi:hypothetical protein
MMLAYFMESSVRRTLVLATGLALASILGGCHPALRLRLKNTGPPPTFVVSGPFGRQNPIGGVNLWGGPTPASEQLLWHIIAVGPEADAASEIAYGRVPNGFKQVFPVDRPPPVIRPGWSYTLEVTPAPGGWAIAPGHVSFWGPQPSTAPDVPNSEREDGT